MKLIYILSQAHSGSTLTDCILGTHPDFISSGEMTYLNWQLHRTKETKSSTEAQNCCTCEQDFRNCEFWSKVFDKIKNKTGKDIVIDPESFDTAYFGKFSYQNRGGFKKGILDKTKGYIFRKWIENGYSFKKIYWLEPKVKLWVENNWLLYETMSEVAQKPVVVDSSKDLRIALLMQQYKPKDVYIFFIHRDPKGLASSYKKWSNKKGKIFSVKDSIKSKHKFERLVDKYKRIKGLSCFDFDYEHIVQYPTDIINEVVREIGANTNYSEQSNKEFYIDPSKQHLVAGNPMRYRGKQLVRYDESWKKHLSDEEIKLIDLAFD